MTTALITPGFRSITRPAAVAAPAAMIGRSRASSISREVTLSSSRFERQGVWRGSHAGFGIGAGLPSVNDYPAYQYAEPAPASFGGYTTFCGT